MRFHYNLTRITSTLHEDVCTFMIVSRCILLLVSDKAVEKIKTIFVFNIFLNQAICEIMWKNIVQPDRTQMAM